METDIYLDVLSLEDVQEVRILKNKITGAWRTPYLLTDKMQENFYNKIVCNRNSNDKYWAIRLIEMPNNIIGMGGINNIQWENRLGEITLFISQPRKGYGEKSLIKILDKAFNELNLNNIHGECYESNPNKLFWIKMIEKSKCYQTLLPNRKFYMGKYYDSIYFNFERINYENLSNSCTSR